jgi:hypothetical protein
MFLVDPHNCVAEPEPEPGPQRPASFLWSRSRNAMRLLASQFSTSAFLSKFKNCPEDYFGTRTFLRLQNLFDIPIKKEKTNTRIISTQSTKQDKAFTSKTSFQVKYCIEI